MKILRLATLALALAASPSFAATYQTFAIDEPNFGVWAIKLNNKGEAIGNYVWQGVHDYAFHRDADGTMYLYRFQFGPDEDMMLWGINDAGRAVGSWGNRGLAVGPHGEDIDFFTVSGADWTELDGIDRKGRTIGRYIDDRVGVAFTRTKKGKIRRIKGLRAYEDAEPVAISKRGYICGNVEDGAATHGFFKGNDKIAVFDVPGAVKTFPSDVNDGGTVAGSYLDRDGRAHGFLRAIDGAITTFDVQGTGETRMTVTAINKSGTVAGAIYDSKGGHGFIRFANGTTGLFDVPGGDASGEYPFEVDDVNDKRQISGVFTTKDHRHVMGFIRTP